MKLALIIEPSDYAHVARLKPFLVGNQVNIVQRCPELISEISSRFDAGIVVRKDFLNKLTFGAKGSNLENFAGSLLKHGQREFVVLDPLEQLVSTRTGEFLVERYLNKILRPATWFKQSEFSWEVVTDESVSTLFDRFSTADLVAVDIETTTDGSHNITCVGYCGIWFSRNGSFTTHSIVIPFTSMFWVQWVRKFNWEIAAPKIFQNGQFDNTYFLRFGCPVYNWCFDTQELFHAWYSELPKRLDAISAFLLRDIYYWKQEGKSGNLQDYYRYNAKDTWATANSWLSAVSECPDWALANYKEKFPLVFPCLSCAFDGFQVNQAGREVMANEQQPKLDESLAKIRRRIGKKDFNPSSPKQVVSLIKALGYEKEVKVRDSSKDSGFKESSGEKILLKVAKKHPLPKLLIESILEYREARKLLNTYIEAELFHGRLLYSLNPSGTDTGRLASKKSSFFGKGAQIQNMPAYVKNMLEADEGFNLFEIDNKNSEGYCVGYLSGDENLIATLTSGRDFHCANAERFFGIPYDQLFDDLTGTVLQPYIRDKLSKKVTHGTNYNMAETVLIETMGAENVLKARELLKLPQQWSLVEIASYLLRSYEKAYPGVKGPWYDFIKASIKLTGLLVSALGWTRKCLGEPWKNKPDLNAYVAHAPQNLSVGIINRGFRRVFWEIQLANWKDFRLKAQIHDSILGQYRIGRLDLVERANQLVRQEVPVTDCKGISRIMRIPTDVKAEARLWSEVKKVKFPVTLAA
jgi:hypothetical protein